MERLMQYWDDLDDFAGALGLVMEKMRSLLLFALTLLMFAALLLGGVWLALTKPPLALAAVILLLVTLMYRTVTNPPGHRSAA